MAPYPECDSVLSGSTHQEFQWLQSRGPGAESLIDLLGHYFTYLELYPGKKLGHFKQLKSVEYKDMFFHNDQENIDEASKLDVTCIHVNARVG